MRRAPLALALLAASAGPASAGPFFMDVEPVAIHAGADDQQLSSMFVISVGRAWEGERVTPYVAGGAGFINLQARAGALVTLHGPWVARLELRPQLSIPCAETAIFGGAGVGYRFARDRVPVTVLAAAETGPAWMHPRCGPDVAMPGPVERTWLSGGTLSVAFGL